MDGPFHLPRVRANALRLRVASQVPQETVEKVLDNLAYDQQICAECPQWPPEGNLGVYGTGYGQSALTLLEYRRGPEEAPEGNLGGVCRWTVGAPKGSIGSPPTRTT